MAVEVNPKTSLYSDKRRNNYDASVVSNTISSKIAQQNDSYADSPSRNLRRSSRVASLSPSSFTPLIRDTSVIAEVSSGSSSTSSTTSSYMPASPSRKYSLMRGGYNGVSIDEITINEIEPENSKMGKTGSYSASYYAPQQLKSSLYPSLTLNTERKHKTLEFQPTNLSTPSSTHLSSTKQQNSSGITPSVNKINIQETPGESNRALEKLVSRGDLEEIAKATPLGSKSTISSSVARQEEQRADKQANSSIVNNNNYYSSNISTSSANLLNKVQIIPNTTNNMAKAANTSKTPQKQTNDNNYINENSDETVKVVRTLRNRSIIASPLPSSTRRSSINNSEKSSHHSSSFGSHKIDIPVYFKKHQKNFLAFSLVALFILATAYHIYDGLTGVPTIYEEIPKEDPRVISVYSEIPQIPSQVTDQVQMGLDKEEVLKIISQISDNRFENIQETLRASIEQKLSSVEGRFQDSLENIRKSQVKDSKPQAPPVEVELQKKALESVASSVKKLEKKFKELESKIDHFQKEIKEVKISPPKIVTTEQPLPTTKVVSIPLRVVKHLCSKPVSGGFFQSSNFPPENALSDTLEPFKFNGNRGKFAVTLPPNLQNFPTEISFELPASRLTPSDRTCLPKDFEIWAIPNPLYERDNPVLLFKGTFDAFKESQTFILKQKSHNSSVKIIQLRIRNNHGNEKFTCLHRFKVLYHVTL